MLVGAKTWWKDYCKFSNWMTFPEQSSVTGYYIAFQALWRAKEGTRVAGVAVVGGADPAMKGKGRNSSHTCVSPCRGTVTELVQRRLPAGLTQTCRNPPPSLDRMWRHGEGSSGCRGWGRVTGGSWCLDVERNIDIHIRGYRHPDISMAKYRYQYKFIFQ